MRAAVDFKNVSIVFGSDPQAALPLMDEGKTRSEIQAATDQVLGVHNCSLTVGEGEILVLMGLSGSGKSTLLRAVNALNPVVRGSVEVLDGDSMVNVTAADSATLRRIRQRSVSMVAATRKGSPRARMTEAAISRASSGSTPSRRSAR